MNLLTTGAARDLRGRLRFLLVGLLLLLSACQSVTGPDEPGLSVAPEILRFGQARNSLPVAISNTGDGMLNWRIEQSPDWVTVAPVAGAATAQDTVLEVTVHRASLADGEYTDSLVVESNGGNQTVPVHLTVDGPFLSVSELSLDFASDRAGQTVRISNIGNGVLHYQVRESVDWLEVSPATGELTDQPGTLDLSVDRTDLSDGDYTASLKIESNANSVVVPLSMNVPVPGG